MIEVYKSIMEQYPKFSLRDLPSNAKQREQRLKGMLNMNTKNSREDISQVLFDCVDDGAKTESDSAFTGMVVSFEVFIILIYYSPLFFLTTSHIETIITSCGWRERPSIYRKQLEKSASYFKRRESSVEIIGIEDCDTVLPVSEVNESDELEMHKVKVVSIVCFLY